MSNNCKSSHDAINMFATEFANMRQHFEESMRRMDENMRCFFSNRLDQSNASATERIGHHEHAGGSILPVWSGQREIVQTDANQSRSLRIRFDLHEFAPENVEVTTCDEKVIVHARHASRTDERKVLKEFRREMTLPNANKLQTILSADGILSLEVPLPIERNTAPKRVKSIQM